MNIEEKYKQDILKDLDPTDSYNKIVSRLNFKEKRNKNGGFIMKKGLVFGLSLAGVALIAGGVIAGVSINNNKNKEIGATSYVVMDVNPSVAFVVDKKNKVVSVSGENEEGKMIICGEDIVGKTLDEAINIVIKVETETGYLVSGNVSNDENKLTFTLNIDDEQAKERLQAIVDSSVKEACDKYHVNETISYAKAYSEDKLNELVASCDTSLTDTQIKAMTYEQKLDVIKLYELETAEMYSTELVNLYNQVKEYNISFASQEFTKTALSELSGLEAALYTAISSLLDGAITQLQSAIDTLNDTRYELFVKEDSNYQKAYDQVKAYKAEVLYYRNEIANLEDGDFKTNALALLDAQEKLLSSSEETLEATKASAMETLDSATATINSAITSINTLKEKVVSSEKLSTILTEKAPELDAYLNEKKTKVFNDFEAKYAEDIAKSKNESLAYKEELKKKVEDSKKAN